MDWLRYSNQNAVRNDPLSPELVKTLSFLPELGLTAEVISGGQENNTTQGTGSTRHTRGNAGDLRFYQGDRLLDFTNLADQKLGAEIVRRSRAGGATGMGWGVDYMGPHTMHIGYGAPAVWGAGGKSANVSPWFRDAYYGAEQTAAPTMMAQNTKGPRMATKPDMTAGGGNQTLLGGSERKGFAGLSPEAWMAISGAFMNMSQPGAGDPQLSAAYGMLGDKRKKTQSAEATNKTVAWLRSNGREDLAAAVESGALDGKSAANLVFSQPEDDSTNSLKKYREMIELGVDPARAMDAAFYGGGTNVNINNEASIPKGYRAVRDENGNLMAYEPVPGGPADDSGNKAVAEANTRRSGDVVIEDIDRVLGKKNDGGLPVAGGIGWALSGVPGTDAHDVSKLITTIKANVGFDRLQQMRDSSPTGGALGAINQTEMALLNSALGNLEQSQSGEQFEENLVRLRDIYTQIIHGPGGGGGLAKPVAGEDPLGLR